MGNAHLRSMRGESRRQFLKFSGAMAAAVGVDRAGYLNWLADEGGHQTAEASISHAHMSLHLVNPQGIFAWWQLLWPHVEVAQANNFGVGKLAYHESSNAGRLIAAKAATDDRAWFASSQAPWIDKSTGVPYPGMEVTAYMAGRDETHTHFPTTAAIISGKAHLVAGAAAIQVQESSAILPVIGVDPIAYGRAPGAPDVAVVPNANGLVQLFNSAASRFVLQGVDNQQIFETYYKAFVGLNRAAPRTTVKPHLDIGKNAAHIIGLNFASQLTPTAADLQMFGINDLPNVSPATLTSTQAKGLFEWGKIMIVTAKAMRLGLTSCGVLSVTAGANSDSSWVDPHVSFRSAADLVRTVNTTQRCGRIMEGFYQYLNQFNDPENAGDKLIDNVVITSHGDTPHSPTIAAVWPDSTPQACNWIYVIGKGHLKHGWFGRVHVNGTQVSNTMPVSGFDGATGQNVLNKASSTTSTVAGGAIAYAISKGDSNFVSSVLGAPLGAYEGVIRDA